MKIIGDMVVLEKVCGISPSSHQTVLRERSGTALVINNADLARAYEILKVDLERRGVNFDEHIKMLIDKQTKEMEEAR